MFAYLPQTCLNQHLCRRHSRSLINTGMQLRWLSANIPGDFSPLEPPQCQAQGSRGLQESSAQRPRLRADLDSRPVPGRTALPRGSSDSALVLPTAHATVSASVARAQVKELWRSGSPAVCLPLADRSHLSHPFLPNTEQYLAQGSYLNVDLTAQSKNRLVFL